MKYLMLIILTAAIFCKTGCSGPQDNSSLMDVDRAFSEFSKEHGMQAAFLHYAADSAVLLQKNTWPIVGKKEIEKLFSLYSDTGFMLTWEPLHEDISRSGDLGFTYGIYTMLNKGTLSESKGKYVTIWKMQEDKTWKFILDGGNEGLGN